ncbi:uncharacterized protein LOC105287869 isoform X2 [Ooceraea biroi]|uniref:uncharacterized protein LOC105287869 isoform X2 n=1 Tax=Ooceraea biroi TaxID=2015173 RepID=UPI0005BC7B8B|nr:uncharacterized protein LOC105287869 isoform X2 [Ooceraea biroi]
MSNSRWRPARQLHSPTGFSEYILTTCREPTAASCGLVGVYENAYHWPYCAVYGPRQEHERALFEMLVRRSRGQEFHASGEVCTYWRERQSVTEIEYYDVYVSVFPS